MDLQGENWGDPCRASLFFSACSTGAITLNLWGSSHRSTSTRSDVNRCKNTQNSDMFLPVDFAKA